jgi:hypothetical protein
MEMIVHRENRMEIVHPAETVMIARQEENTATDLRAEMEMIVHRENRMEIVHPAETVMIARQEENTATDLRAGMAMINLAELMVSRLSADPQEIDLKRKSTKRIKETTKKRNLDLK